MKRLPDTFTTRIAGATMRPAYPDNLLQLNTIDHDRQDAYLEREPDNLFDPNAVRVHCFLGAKWDPVEAKHYSHVGYVPGHVAATLAPLMDAGEKWGCEVDEVMVDPHHPDRPGLTINIIRTTTK